MKNKTYILLLLSTLILTMNCSRKVYVAGASTNGNALLSNVVDSSKVSINFSSSLGTYTQDSVSGSNIDIGNKTCVNAGWKTSSSFNPDTMYLDEYLPSFEEHLTLNILPNESGTPVDYNFSARVSDRGCGSTNIIATCAIWNMTASSDIAYGTLERGVIPDPFVWAPGQTCLSKSGQFTNNFAEFVRHVINHARINDRLRFEMYIQDGSGNYSPSTSLDFYKYEKLLGAISLSTPN